MAKKIVWFDHWASANAIGPLDWDGVAEELAKQPWREAPDGGATRAVDLGGTQSIHPRSLEACRRACARRGYRLELGPHDDGRIVQHRPTAAQQEHEPCP